MLLDRATRACTLQDLEGVDWGDPEPDNPSALALRCKLGRRVALENLDPLTLKMLLGQAVGMKWLVPLALERLSVDPWLETQERGLLIEGILELPSSYWDEHPQFAAVWGRIIDRALREAGDARRKSARSFDPAIRAQLENLRGA